VRLWDTKTWNLVRSLDSNAQTLSFTPDGKQLAVTPFLPTVFTTHSTGGKNKPMSIWDVASGKESATFPEQGDSIHWGVFADGGNRLVTLDKKVAVWDVASRKQIAQSSTLLAPGIFGGTGLLDSPVLTPDGKTVILAITKDGGVRQITTALHAIDLDNGKERFAFPVNTCGVIALAADGKTLASGDIRGIRLWDLAQRREIRRLDPDFGKDVRGVSVLAFSPNGRLLASAGGLPQHMGDVPDAPRIRLWDVKTGKEVASFPADEGLIASLAFSPDGKRLLSGMWNGSILVWDVATRTGGLKP